MKHSTSLSTCRPAFMATTRAVPFQLTRIIVLSALFAFSTLIISLNTAIAGEADVLDAKIHALGNGQYRIDVTVEHGDDGWDHYANRWDVLGPDAQLLGERILAHPHDNEQPFTRSLRVSIPEHISVITIRANDSVHGLGGATLKIKIPDPS